MAESERVQGGGDEHEVVPPTIEKREGDGTLSGDDLPKEIQEIVDKQADDSDLTLDEIFELLKNERRREVINYLLESEDGTATLSDLAELIAAKENDIEVSQLSSDQRKRVYIGLYQCHLPKMDDMGVIDFEDNRGTVELSDTIEQVQPYLDRASTSVEATPPWVELGVTAGVIGVLVVAMVGIEPFGSLPPAGLAGLSTIALVGIALYQVVKHEAR